MVHLLESLTPTVAEHSENGQGNGYPNPLTIALYCTVKPELVEGERTVVSGVPVLPVDSYRCWYATAIADNATLWLSDF